jgi:hypothetical protein
MLRHILRAPLGSSADRDNIVAVAASSTDEQIQSAVLEMTTSEGVFAAQDRAKHLKIESF